MLTLQSSRRPGERVDWSHSQAKDKWYSCRQQSDLLQARKTIPDFATWGQCFAIYVAVLASKYPERLLSDHTDYLTVIANASKQYSWPAWVIYDQQFRQDSAGNPGGEVGEADPNRYAQCFTGQEISKENWCNSCQELDHKTADRLPIPTKEASMEHRDLGIQSSQVRKLEAAARPQSA